MHLHSDELDYLPMCKSTECMYLCKCTVILRNRQVPLRSDIMTDLFGLASVLETTVHTYSGQFPPHVSKRVAYHLRSYRNAQCFRKIVQFPLRGEITSDLLGYGLYFGEDCAFLWWRVRSMPSWEECGSHGI